MPVDKKTVNDILKLNQNFYELNGADFSETRNKPWKGWELIPETVKNLMGFRKLPISVLDIGCGNGRFYESLNQNVGLDFNYEGWDTSNVLLNIARKRFKQPNTKFLNKDFLKPSDIAKKYDLIVGFGITHHIPSDDIRKKWFSKISIMLSKGGILVLSFWEKNFKPGDYLIGWKNKSDSYRYFHEYSKIELNEINKIMIKHKLSLLKKYNDKINTKKPYNIYYIWQK